MIRKLFHRQSKKRKVNRIIKSGYDSLLQYEEQSDSSSQDEEKSDPPPYLKKIYPTEVVGNEIKFPEVGEYIFETYTKLYGVTIQNNILLIKKDFNFTEKVLKSNHEKFFNLLTIVKTLDPSYKINGHTNVDESHNFYTITLRDLEYPNGKFDVWIRVRKAIKLNGKPDFKTYFISLSDITKTY